MTEKSLQSICTHLLLAALVSGSATTSSRADPPDPSDGGSHSLSELRLGVLGHDVGIFGNSVEHGWDLNGEFLFRSPDLLAALGSPRPHLGASVNTAGKTSQAYTGLTWSHDFTEALFAEFSVGGAYGTSKIDKSDPDRKDMGSQFGFRESLSAGWRLSPTQNMSVMLDHVSNAGLARYNGGMDSIGVRFGQKF